MRETFPIIRSTFKGDSGLVDQIEEILNQAIVYRDQIFQLITDGKDDEAFEIMNNEYIPSWIRWVIYSSEIAGSNAKRMVEEGERAVIFSTVIVRIILGASILFAILLGIYLSNSVRKPVTELEKAAKMISDGDMNAVITYHSRDELGSLSESMRTTVHRLSSIISDLSYLLQEIAGGYFHLHTKVEQDYVGDFQPLLLTLRQNRD